MRWRGRRPDGGRPEGTDRLGRLAHDVGGLRVGGRRSVDERSLMVLGGVLVPLGLLVILLGWYGASRTSNLFEQIPYLISGGLLGLALVFLGAFLYFAHWLTRLVQEQRTRSAAVVDAVDRLVEAVDRRWAAAGPVIGGGAPPSPAAEDEDEDQIALVATAAGTLAHRRTCRVVAGRSGLRTVGAADGLAPCRLCQPYR